MARIRYGTPLWLDRLPTARRPSYPRYPAAPRTAPPAQTDVVIVGGGLAGCLTAYVFRKAGVRVVLLEAERVGQQSAASLGWVPESPGVPFRTLQDEHGLKAARRIWEASRRSALDAAALLRRLGIKCDLERADAVVAAPDSADLKQLEREHQARVAAGIDAASLNARRVATELRSEGLTGAIRTRSDGLCDPYRACLGLAAAAIKAGAAFYEQTPVVKVRAGRKLAEVKTATSSIIARTVVMATGDPGPGCGALRRHVRALDTYCVATPPLPAALLRALGPRDVVLRDGLVPYTLLNGGVTPPHTLRFSRDGRIVLQGGDQKPVTPKQREKAIIQRTGQLMYELSRLYPAISGTPPEYGWSTRSVTATDGLLLAGPHRNFPRHLFAIGLGATGLSGAYLAARVLLRHYQEEADAADELFGFGRVQPVRS